MLKQNTVYYIKDNSGNGQVASDHTKSKKCTLKDIARRSDLSCAAVSQILNNRGGAFTSEATKSWCAQSPKNLAINRISP